MIDLTALPTDALSELHGVLAKYSEDQPRDDHGRFAGGGGDDKPSDGTAGATGSSPTPVDLGDRTVYRQADGTLTRWPDLHTAISEYTQAHPETDAWITDASPIAGMAALDSLDRLQTEFPGVAISDIALTPAFEFGSPTYLADTSWGNTSEIRINDAAWGKDAPAGALYQPSTGFHPPGTDNPSGTITHEFGHAVQSAIDARLRTANDATLTAYLHFVGALPTISGYAQTADHGHPDARENFAETFAAAYSGNSPSTPGTEMMRTYLASTGWDHVPKVASLSTASLVTLRAALEKRLVRPARTLRSGGPRRDRRLQPIANDMRERLVALAKQGGTFTEAKAIAKDCYAKAYKAGWLAARAAYRSAASTKAPRLRLLPTQTHDPEDPTEAQDIENTELEDPTGNVIGSEMDAFDWGDDYEEEDLSELWDDPDIVDANLDWLGNFWDRLLGRNQDQQAREEGDDQDLEANNDALDSGADGFTASLNPVYEQGFAFSAADGEGAAYDDGAVTVTWIAEGDSDTCNLCADRDGQSWQSDEDFPFPGEGDFGEVCDGAANCRCELEYSLPDGSVVTGDVAAIARPTLVRYSDDQPRDEHGRWTSDGGGDDTGSGDGTGGGSGGNWSDTGPSATSPTSLILGIGGGNERAVQDAMKEQAAKVPSDWRNLTPAQTADRVTQMTGTVVRPDVATHVRPEDFRQAMYQYTQLAQRFPEARLDVIARADAQTIRAMGGPESALAATGRVDGKEEMRLAGQAWDTNGRFSAYGPDTGWHPEGTYTPAGIVTHEFGHVVYDHLAHEAVAGTDRGRAFTGWNVDHLTGAEGRISGYATTPREDWAERFAAAYAPGSRATGDSRARSVSTFLRSIGYDRRGKVSAVDLAKLTTADLVSLRAALTKYSPDQERDEHGRFAGGGGDDHPDTGTTETSAVTATVAPADAKVLLGTLSNLQQQFPGVRVRTVGMANGAPTEIAYTEDYRDRSSSIFLSNHYFGPTADQHMGNDQSWRAAADRGLASVMTHEFGHAVENNVMLSRGESHDSYEQWRQNYGEAASRISGYAATDHYEAFAEAFASAFTPGGDRSSEPAAVSALRDALGPIMSARKYSDSQPRDDHGRWSAEDDDGYNGPETNTSTASAKEFGKTLADKLNATPGWSAAGLVVDPTVGRDIAAAAKMMSQNFPMVARDYPVNLTSTTMEHDTVARTTDYEGAVRVMGGSPNPGDTLTGEHAIMQLNKSEWASPTFLPSSLAREAAQGWGAPGTGHNPESVLVHEYGHVVDQWTGGKGTAMAEKWNPATTVSGYGRSSATEAFAEAFRATFYTDKSQWTPDVRATDRFIAGMRSGRVTEGRTHGLAATADLTKYSEDQPRDDHGRFGEGGGDSKVPDPGPQPVRPLPEGYDSLTLDQQTAFFDEKRDAMREWSAAMATAVSVGAIPAEEALARGWSPNLGQATITAMPTDIPMYHATVALDAVQNEGLRTRDEIGAAAGTGLGGGQSDSISVTTNPEYAQTIADAITGLHDLLGAPNTSSVIEDAKRGGFDDQLSRFAKVYVGSDPAAFDREYVREAHTETALFAKTPEAWQAEHPGDWKPIESAKIVFPDGTAHYMQFERPMTQNERDWSRYNLYNAYLTARSVSGGRENPVFFSPNLAALRETPRDQIGVVTVHALPGSQGYYLPAEQEWRTWSGRALRVDSTKSATADLAKYSDDEPRDDHGRWTSDGGSDDTSSPSAVAGQIASNAAGFSVHPYRASFPTTGYQVAMTGRTTKLPDTILQDRQKLADAIRTFVNANHDLLRPGGKVYIGGWTHEGTLYLEPSERVTGRAEAIRVGTERGQYSVWDNARQEEIVLGGTAGLA